MSPLDAANDVVQLLKTAGLKKETFDLVESKLSSLTGELIVLEDENARLKEEMEKLKAQTKGLESQIEELSPESAGVLKLFFDQGKDISAEEIAAVVKWKQSVVDYHLDVLLKKKFIREVTLGLASPSQSGTVTYGLTTLGRRYALQNSAA